VWHEPQVPVMPRRNCVYSGVFFAGTLKLCVSWQSEQVAFARVLSSAFGRAWKDLR